MIITAKQNKKVVNCINYSTVRIDYNPENNNFPVTPCCYAKYDEPLGILTEDNIKNNNVYDLLLDFYKSYKKYKVRNYCFTGQLYDYKKCDPDNYLCLYNQKELKSVMVNIQNSCNLTCKMCRDHILLNKELDKLYFLTLEQLKGHKIHTLMFTQNGEPFLYKHKMFDYLNSLTVNDDFTKLYFISNLTLLNDKNLENLLELKNKGFIIKFCASIDGITADTYKKIRQNNFFDRVMHNANFLADNNMLESVNFVVQDDNIHELKEACNYWLFNKKIWFSPIPLNQGVPNADQSSYIKILNNETYQYVKNLINNTFKNKN